MGRLIEADEYIKDRAEYGWLNDISVKRFNEITPTVEAIPIADYENRLNADMVAMLTEIQLEIEEAECHRYDDQLDLRFNKGLHKANDIIQEKINVLKAEK